MTSSFPIPLLTSISGVPTFASLTKLQKELNTNAESVKSTRGNGRQGHLVLTYRPHLFVDLPGHIPFVPPEHPGMHPILTPNATAHVTRTVTRAFDTTLKDFELYWTTETSLKQQLLTAIEPIYMQPLEHEHRGLAEVTTLQILTHLWNEHGKLENDDIQNNQREFVTPWWHPPTPIQELFAKIDRQVILARAGNAPISDVAIVQTAYNNVEATGLFELDLKLWRRRTPAESTYAAFQTFFIMADKDRTRTTASDMGFGQHRGANTIQTVATHNIATIQPIPVDNVNAVQNVHEPPLTAAAITKLVIDLLKQDKEKKEKKTGKVWCHTHGYCAHTSEECHKRKPDHDVNARPGPSKKPKT